MFEYIFVHAVIVLSFIKELYTHVDSAKLEEECKIADICRHDQVAVCGIDSCGEMRTFIDTCDMHEFNCDSKKGRGSWQLSDYQNSFPNIDLEGTLIPGKTRKKIQCRQNRWTVYDEEAKRRYVLCNAASRFHNVNCLALRVHDFVPKPAHECWVTCKRGRSFKKPLYSSNCI